MIAEHEQAAGIMQHLGDPQDRQEAIAMALIHAVLAVARTAEDIATGVSSLDTTIQVRP
jgi:hypothetical protein